MVYTDASAPNVEVRKPRDKGNNGMNYACMDMDDDACYRAIETRDRRFDGRLFVAVTTTGIYCRPFCPAPTPKRENVRFFPTAAAAQKAGFRPCLRCRPETAPELALWRGESNTVSRALGLIEAGALDSSNVDALATRLGSVSVSSAACSEDISAHLRSRSLRPGGSFWPSS
jgi:methylphosphotriester-DNA--protein-cysteine methyltransferase